MENPSELHFAIVMCNWALSEYLTCEWAFGERLCEFGERLCEFGERLCEFDERLSEFGERLSEFVELACVEHKHVFIA